MMEDIRRPPTGAEAPPGRPGESPRAYAALCEYLAMGPGRSLAKLCRQASGETPAGNIRLYERWSVRFDWQARAKDHDLRLEAARQAARQAAAAKHAYIWEIRSHRALEAVYQDAQKIRSKARQAIDTFPVSAVQSVDGRTATKSGSGRLSFVGACAALKISAELESAALSAATRDRPVDLMSKAELEATVEAANQIYQEWLAKEAELPEPSLPAEAGLSGDPDG